MKQENQANSPNSDFQVGIIGAGFGGIVAALQLQKSGRNSFVVFERAAEIGGTWRDNVYPGCACDVESHLYSIADQPNPDWSMAFSPQAEIWNYLKKVVERNHLETHIRLNTDIVELNYLEERKVWEVTDRNSYTVCVQVILLAIGPLNRPNIPDFTGKDTFTGKQFHSSHWDTTLDLSGKRIAVIGTGASSIQIVPAIAPIVDQLLVFQRSAAWVTPRMNRKISRFEKKLFLKIPFTQKLYREGIYWLKEFLGLGFVGTAWLNRLSTWVALQKLKKEVKDPEIRKKLIPDYQLGCKRVLVSDDYYPAFNRSNVRLITESIGEITPEGIRTENGQKFPVDAIVYATGFEAAEVRSYTKITGQNGRVMGEEWEAEGVQAYHGTTVSGYPNLAFILGPNTGLGHNSVIHMMESQMHYILQYLAQLEKMGPLAALDVKPAIQSEYNRALQAKFKGTVWASGCRSWYINHMGVNTTIYPRLTAAFRKETKRFELKDYDLV